VMLPLLWHQGLAAYVPVDMKGQFWRGGVHTIGLMLWFVALPQIPLADMTAIGFTGPIFIMLGAAWFLGEPMRKDRWIAAIIGFAGVLVVVVPNLSGAGGWYNLVMLASSPVFAASFLITKHLTRTEKPGVIVMWQSITVTLFSLPLALMNWQAPTLFQWGGFMVAGVLGTIGHYSLTKAFSVADISATQSLRFLDLVWASRSFWCPLFGLHDAKAAEKKSLRRSVHRKPEAQGLVSPDGALLGGGLLMPLATWPAGTCCAADSM
ncbi:MAG: DMT family transporter, partial [Limnohabitans sp.]|nr:DMT family transporter [Limnohabitans sp.]